MKRPQAPIGPANGEARETGDLVYESYCSARTGRATLTARVAEAPPAPTYTSARIARIRDGLRLSQAVFAMALNVSPETVRAWEQGKREPDGAALRLLQIAEQHPEWIMETVSIRDRAARVGTQSRS
jgi:putative transcriptional regulator